MSLIIILSLSVADWLAGRLLLQHRAALLQTAKHLAALFLQAARSVTHTHMHVHPEEGEEFRAAGEKDRPAQTGGADLSERAAAVLRTVLSDYVESIARFAVGPQKTVYFIHDCLR